MDQWECYTDVITIVQPPRRQTLWLGWRVYGGLVAVSLLPVAITPSGSFERLFAFAFSLAVAIVYGGVWLASGAVFVVLHPKGLTEGCCPHCGYDLTGNASGVCPECGNRIAPGLKMEPSEIETGFRLSAHISSRINPSFPPSPSPRTHSASPR